VCQADLVHAAIVRVLVLAPLFACTPKPQEPGTPPPRACTDMGCMDGLRIQMTKATAWPAGEYEMTFDLDGTAVNCKGSLPLPACEQGPALSCTPTERVQVGESGCALPPEQHGWADVQIAESPTRVQVTIRHGAEVLHTSELQPQYRTLQPNGPGCEPTCRSAGATITLP
jgi:hypothetical protein